MTAGPSDQWQWRSAARTDRAVVTLSGELDVNSADELGDLLHAVIQDTPVVDLDLAQVAFLDSTILSVFIRASRTATDAGGSLALLNPTRHVRRVLEITGVLPLFGPDDEPGSVRADAL
ncbi:STAS domain-containing protein [Micromonospora sp. URMC 103]|uniref:STAS domain-containing protein n=1 Tax=Micromonospora sp. URMC 103 TaxID=3423406 RepID=UPI003F1B1AEC